MTKHETALSAGHGEGARAPWRMTATEALAEIGAGRLDPEDWVRSCLRRIADLEPQVRAFTALDEPALLRAARESVKAAPAALRGLPVAVKDMIDVAGYATTHNSPIHAGDGPAVKDAACVSVLRGQGALVVGKTDTTEFAAAGRHAATRNPHGLRYSAGGSSSGSAAAVAAGMVPVAIGTQTGGSLIRPASYCGVYAFKPTHGLVSREGAKQYSYSFDTIGWYARDVADLSLLAGAFRLFSAPAPAGRPLRVGLCPSVHADDADACSREQLALAAERLRAAGHTVVDHALPDDCGDITAMQRLVMIGEGRASFLPEYLNARPKLHQDFVDRVENANGTTPDALCAAYDGLARARALHEQAMQGLDALLTIAAPGEAPVGNHPGHALHNAMWTALHVPCVAIPSGRGPTGLPVGLQITGPRFGDHALLEVARRIAPAIDTLHPARVFPDATA